MNTIKSNTCPVCLMDVKGDNIIYDYLEICYFFCSVQCKDRFISNPHLYTGYWGASSAKQRGESILKKRILKLEKDIPDNISKIIYKGLNEMMGIKEINIAGNRISICYDLLIATAKQIENKIEEMGVHLDDNWAEHLRLAFVHYIEETEIDNLEQDTFSHNQHKH